MTMTSWDPFSTEVGSVHDAHGQRIGSLRSPTPSPIGWLLIVIGLVAVCGGCAASVALSAAQGLGQIGYPHPLSENERSATSDFTDGSGAVSSFTPEQYRNIWAIIMASSLALAMLAVAVSVVVLAIRDRAWRRRSMLPRAAGSATTPTNGPAIGGVIVGVLSLTLCVLPYVSLPLAALGLVLGIAGLRWVRLGRSTRKGFAITAVAVSAYGLFNIAILMGGYTYVIFTRT